MKEFALSTSLTFEYKRKTSFLSIAVLALLFSMNLSSSFVSAQQEMKPMNDLESMKEMIKNAEHAMAFKDSVVEALGPLWEIMEPYKVHEGSIARGVPAIH